MSWVNRREKQSKEIQVEKRGQEKEREGGTHIRGMLLLIIFTEN